jgi:hypothetical protein
MSVADNLIPVQTLDAPSVFDASVDNIPGSGSSQLQVVASLTHKIYGIHFYDGIGKYIGVYAGPVGQESYVCTIAGGSWGTKAIKPISAGTRISLRSMKSTSIALGTLFIEFLGRS